MKLLQNAANEEIMEHDDEYPILVAQDGHLKGQRWALSSTLMVGRDPGCDIQVQDRQDH